LKDWTPSKLVLGGLGDLAHAPVRALLFLGVVPGLWMAPTYLAPSTTTAVIHPGWWLLIRIGTVTWGSVLAGGVFLAAMNLVRRVPFGSYCFVQGLRYWPRITCLELALSLPPALLSLAHPLLKMSFYGKGVVDVALACAALIGTLVLIRMVIAVLVVVDRDVHLLDALSASWYSTAGAQGRIAVLVIAFIVPAAAWAIRWKGSPLGQQLGWVVLRPVCLLVWVRLYQQLQSNSVVPKP